MIEVKNLSKYYGRVTAIDDVSFRVKKGEILGFLGPNAAGKTTTMRILACFLPASGGEARVAGHDVFSESMAVRKLVGYLPENVPLYNDMRVWEYLTYRARLKEIPRNSLRERVGEVMGKCWITDVRNRLIGVLSKGYRQRVGLASAIIHDPPVLILDEPTIGLDPNQIRETRKLIRELGGEHTILLSTHILPEVEMTCERVVIINKGKVVAVDTPANLTQQWGKGARISLEVKGPGEAIKEALEKAPGVKSVKWEGKAGTNRYRVSGRKERDIREEVSRAITGAGGVILEMRPEAVSLEDVFVHITTQEPA